MPLSQSVNGVLFMKICLNSVPYVFQLRKTAEILCLKILSKRVLVCYISYVHDSFQLEGE